MVIVLQHLMPNMLPVRASQTRFGSRLDAALLNQTQQQNDGCVEATGQTHVGLYIILDLFLLMDVSSTHFPQITCQCEQHRILECSADKLWTFVASTHFYMSFQHQWALLLMVTARFHYLT